ncbi:MAG: DUF3604 domain-containing protein, partial [Pseudomonadota bacterium]
MKSIALPAILAMVCATTSTHAAEQKQLLWGDTHLHTSYSFDAFLNGNLSADPDTAYRWAQGLPVIHPYTRARVQIQTPLDFLVISDHAEFYGGLRDIYLDGVQVEDPGVLESIGFWWAEREIREAIDSGNGPEFFVEQLPPDADPTESAKAWVENIGAATQPGAAVSATNAWQRARQAAEKHNQPGKFSTILGWEWSSIPGGSNLHRVVMTDADGETAGQFLPFGSNQSPYPSDLWRWLDQTSAATGANFVAIPHNPNISKGYMFGKKALKGEPIDRAYAEARSRWETVAEVTQYKGDSETHPDLSPDDPFADFEIYPFYIQRVRTKAYAASSGDYMRSGLRNGLELEADLGINPYQFGV